MRLQVPFVAIFYLAGCEMLCQTPGKPEFEVATVKAAPMLTPGDAKAGKLHLGITVDGQRVDIGYMSLLDLISRAYSVKRFQVDGPDWIITQRFDIQAKLPEGATREQVPEMLQALLAERFHLAVHRGTKDHAVYELVVGKNGPKLKEAAPDAIPLGQPTAFGGSGGAVSEVKSDNQGRFVVNNGALKMHMLPNGLMHYEFAAMTIDGLTNFLTGFLDRPVVDKTNLKGTFEVDVDLSRDDLMAAARSAGMPVPGPGNRPATNGTGGNAMPADAASDPSGSVLFQSVQQLGLKLEPRKASMETIVIDHLEKTPTEN